MWRKSVIVGTLSASLVWAGCARPLASTDVKTDGASLAVRFVSPPQTWQPRDDRAEAQDTLVVDSLYDGFAENDWSGTEGRATAPQMHVALWGGPFEGQDVTYGVTSLSPGEYTAAFFDRPHGMMLQGWFDVRGDTGDILGMLYNWKNSIAEQKHQLAYGFELEGAAWTDNRADNLNNFSKQLRALERFERQLDGVIAAETEAKAADRARAYDLLHNVDLLIIPSEEPVFRSTTQAVFNDADLTNIRNEGAVTKFVVVADYDNAMSRLNRVNALYGELTRCKAVMEEQVDRLMRRKGLLLLTDHLRNDDQSFMDNERSLQRTIGAIDCLEQQMNDLRERRLALAFALELVAPNTAFPMLDQEERALLRERAAVEADIRRLNQVMEQTSEASVRHVALERDRQRVASGMDALDRHLDRVAKSRSALMAMSSSTQVIHRQGDGRVLTATFVGDRLPFSVRSAVERESLMTVRLEAGKNLVVPTPNSAAVAAWQTGPADTRNDRYAHGSGDHRGPGPADTRNDRHAQDSGDHRGPRPADTRNNQWTPDDRTEEWTASDRATQRTPDDGTEGWTASDRAAQSTPDDGTESTRVQLVQYPAEEPPKPQAQDLAHRQDEKRKPSCARSWKWLFPPCWLAERLSNRQTERER